MEKLTIKGDWKIIAGKLKQEYADLTDDDLLFAEGKEEELIGRLQKKLGKTKEQIREKISKLQPPFKLTTLRAYLTLRHFFLMRETSRQGISPVPLNR